MVQFLLVYDAEFTTSIMVDKAGANILHYAAVCGNCEALQVLLPLSKNCINDADKKGSSVLHYAAASGSTACVYLLLEYGAAADATDNAWWPPILYADFTAQKECIMALLRRNQAGQLQILGELVKNDRDKEKVLSVFKSLTSEPDYFDTINIFFKNNNELLEKGAFSFLMQNRYLLSFKNNKMAVNRAMRKLRSATYGSCSTVKGHPSHEWTCMMK